MMKLSLEKKVVLVTGASRGIGAAIARHLGASDARLALHYNSGEIEVKEVLRIAGGNGMCFQANLSSAEESHGLIPRVIEKMGPVDVLINNAGIVVTSQMDKADEDWISDWDLTLDVNLRAAAALSRAYIHHRLSLGLPGRLIHIASRAGFRGDIPEYLAYAASKGGMLAMSKSIARGYGKQDIMSFAIAPGFTRTAMAEEFISEFGEESILSDIALPRLTEPEDIAPTVTLLASGLADHATGTTIDFNAASYVR